jgi:hypothetical protein
MWFSPGAPASSTAKTDRHDIAEILLQAALITINQIKSNQICFFRGRHGCILRVVEFTTTYAINAHHY